MRGEISYLSASTQTNRTKAIVQKKRAEQHSQRPLHLVTEFSKNLWFIIKNSTVSPHAGEKTEFLTTAETEVDETDAILAAAGPFPFLDQILMVVTRCFALNFEQGFVVRGEQ